LTSNCLGRVNDPHGEWSPAPGLPLGLARTRQMKPNIFSTRDLRPRDQLEAWREWYEPVFDVVSKQSIGDEFPADIHLWKLGGLAVSRTSAPSVHVVRTKAHLRRDPVDHWVISYCARGAHFAMTAGTELEVPARVPFIWSLGQEFLHERTDVDRVQFLMARDAFRDIAPPLDAACGSTLDTPLGDLLGDSMMAVERRLPAVTEADFPRLSSAVGAMVAAAVAPSAERSALAAQQIELGRKERVRQAVRRHLRTPTLGPKTLSRVVGMSRSNLYRLFEDTGGVVRYIQRERLLEAQSILSDLATTQSISAIAEDLCFADASSFSRVFKREFGYSPTEVRSAALAGLAVCSTPRNRGRSERADFSELLHGF
jgi:AraC-like DNA-binding protein